MPTYTISKLARIFGLSRSALLYYDRIGLLSPSSRTRTGYRCYTDEDHERLEQICAYRQAGLTLEDIRALLKAHKPGASVVKRRLQAIGREIQELKSRRRHLLKMLNMLAEHEIPPMVDKAMWIDMLRSAGMDEQAMNSWHAEFEKRAPKPTMSFCFRWEFRKTRPLRSESGRQNPTIDQTEPNQIKKAFLGGRPFSGQSPNDIKTKT